MLDEAARLGYEGIEVRGIEGGCTCPRHGFLCRQYRSDPGSVGRKKLSVCRLGTSCGSMKRKPLEHMWKKEKHPLTWPMKVARSVLRGGSLGNGADLPDCLAR